MLKILYVARSFLDYRVPVFAALDELTEGGLHVFFSAEVTPSRVGKKISKLLGDRSIGFKGEVCLGPKRISSFANAAVRFVYQPGLFKAIQHVKPDVVIGDGFFQWTSFAFLYRLLYAAPLVICYERTFHTERNAQWYRMLYRKLILHWVDAMACNGRLCAEYAQWLGMPSQRITLGHMAADTTGLQAACQDIAAADRLAWRRRWDNPDCVFLFVGNLIDRKGIKQLLTSWAEGKKSWDRKIALVVVGDGPERAALESQVHNAGLQSVHFEGAVDYDHIAPYYAAADAFVIPTLEDNWSLVVPEAMACGLPILCSKYNGCWPELVQPQNGWVFDPLNPQDTLRVLNLAIIKSAELPNMGQASREIIAQHTPEHAARAIFEACEIALKRHGKNIT